MKALIVIIEENKSFVEKTNVIKVLQNKWVSTGKNGYISVGGKKHKQRHSVIFLEL